MVFRNTNLMTPVNITHRHYGENPYPGIMTGRRINPGRTECAGYFMPRYAGWSCLLLLVFLMLLSFAPPANGATPADREEKEVLKAARKFLDAEIRRDYPAIWACFAPSSVYVQRHTYQQYLDEARITPDRVVSYQIIRICYIQDNKDPQTPSTADKIAQVEVDVTFLHEGTNRRSVVNIGFIFLKERGKWYKG